MTVTASKPILIVDDDAEMRAVLSCALEGEGYEVALAGNGGDALDLIRIDGLDPALIILDLQMPKMNGIEFRGHQQKDPELTDIPVVIYSGSDDVHRTARALDCEHSFRKPLHLAPLLALIHRYVAPRPRA